ncbi:outer membrane protein [Notoacmeibacter sp. MSK16QG-6]|uniref:outer membrane protein n=1 Tax=Notoacmeibacter sp. MSK16QG-6 TaxID=2957982 RepID=UPI00209FB404|nr:outer membrane protein [Notoacmeibacter sp. MSK16QG-6]MCP1199283.1 porin family protein [Notoacmeibacter sp. MSK16QG-6]
MFRVMLLATALGISSTTAFAADAVVYDPPVMEEGFSWSGPYAGLQLGYGWADTDWTYQTGGDTVDVDPDGVFGGLYAGYNYQFGSLVAGAEIEANIADIDDETDCPSAAFDCRGEVNAFGSLRARFGYAADRFLAYGTGGLALGHMKIETEDLTGNVNNEGKVLLGYTVGGGVETLIGSNVVLRAEYDYYNFEDEDFTVDGGNEIETDLDMHTIRFGLAYKF